MAIDFSFPQVSSQARCKLLARHIQRRSLRLQQLMRRPLRHDFLATDVISAAPNRPLRIHDAKTRQRPHDIALCGTIGIDLADITPIAAFLVRLDTGYLVIGKVLRERAAPARQQRHDVAAEVDFAIAVAPVERRVLLRPINMPESGRLGA